MTTRGDFLLAPACSIDKVTLWEGIPYSTPGFEIDEGVLKDHFLPNWELNQGPRVQGPACYPPCPKPSLHPA